MTPEVPARAHTSASKPGCEPPRRIAHLDMDAFYASVELLRFPQLAQVPVVIGGSRFDLPVLWQHLNRTLPMHLGRPWGQAPNVENGACAAGVQPSVAARREHPAHIDSPGPRASDSPSPLAASHMATPEAAAPWHPENDLAHIPLAAFARLRHYKGRGVITTATYAARAYGIGSAMGLMKAAQRCPDAVLLPVDFERYRHFSRLFKAEILRVAPIMENRGIDEVYIDLTHAPNGQRDHGAHLARELQVAIHRATGGLTCSIGIAPNKLLAKMASEFHKPNGIAVVLPSDLARLIWPLACGKINGIGPKTQAALAQQHIHTIGQLAACDPNWLRARFGNHHGQWLHDAAWGRDDRPVVTHSEPVSLSRETTFARDLHAVHDKTELGQHFTRLCEQVAQDLARKGLSGRTVGIKLRYDNFQSVTRDQSVALPIDAAMDLRRVAGQCLKRVDLSRKLRLLGVRVSALQSTHSIAPAIAPQNAEVPIGQSLPLF